MGTSTYQVVLSGDLLDGATIEDVTRRMAALFKTAEHKIEGLLKQENPVVKRNIDRQTAGKYRQAIEKTGAACRIEPMADPKQPAAGQTQTAAESPEDASGPNVVPIQLLYKGEERFCPQEIEKINGSSNGFNFNLPEYTGVAFSRLSAISAFTSEQNGEETVRLLLFVSPREMPFICPIEHIAFSDFPVQPLAKPVATFRNFLHFLCRQNPAMILEEATFDFLSGSTLPNINAAQIQKLATAIGKLIESGEAE